MDQEFYGPTWPIHILLTHSPIVCSAATVLRPSVFLLARVATLWRTVVPHGYSYKASYARPG